MKTPTTPPPPRPRERRTFTTQRPGQKQQQQTSGPRHRPPFDQSRFCRRGCATLHSSNAARRPTFTGLLGFLSHVHSVANCTESRRTSHLYSSSLHLFRTTFDQAARTSSGHLSKSRHASFVSKYPDSSRFFSVSNPVGLVAIVLVVRFAMCRVHFWFGRGCGQS